MKAFQTAAFYLIASPLIIVFSLSALIFIGALGAVFLIAVLFGLIPEEDDEHGFVAKLANDDKNFGKAYR